MDSQIEAVLKIVSARNHTEKLFLQAVHEVFGSLAPVICQHPELVDQNILERLSEPDEQIMFRITWQDDAGVVHVNRGFRVHFNNALGPYKGGLRFHPSVNLGTVKFLAFEQIFKNALTDLSIGGGKGGSDFNPKGRSDGEVMRFCQAFMTELWHQLGDRRDVPAGDIGVGAREIGYLFGQYKRLTKRHEAGVLTGKPVGWGGSCGRTEATGYGCVYFAQDMLSVRNETLEGRICVVSGSGNVALYAIQKLQQFGARVVAASDSRGVVHDPAGIDFELLRMIKEDERLPIWHYVERRGRAKYLDGGKVWGLPCECAFPCATQNELDENDARQLVDGGCQLVCEGANMPSTPEAVEVFREAKALFGPGKAANAGGVAVSALEMQQNAGLEQWSFAEVDRRLHEVMSRIHAECRLQAEAHGVPDDYLAGANIGGFKRVAQAMMEQGVV